MSKEVQRSATLRRKKNAMASTASAVIAAVSLLGASLGVSAAAPVEDAGPTTNTRDGSAAGTKLAQALSTQDTLRRSQPMTVAPSLQSNQFNTPALRSDQHKQQLQSNQFKTPDLRSNQFKTQTRTQQAPSGQMRRRIVQEPEPEEETQMLRGQTRTQQAPTGPRARIRRSSDPCEGGQIIDSTGPTTAPVRR
jgi:hypothetical protein